nr:polyribonucleotide nucleotidyltransferase [Streptococcus sp. DD12]
MAKECFEFQLAGKTLEVETGELARQANGACLVRCGGTAVLSVAVMSDVDSQQDFFPLQVLYEERAYAAGKIPGGFKKREGRPSLEATLAARMIDRTLRPLFPKELHREVQIVNTVLSYDASVSPSLLALLGSSLALTLSDIPFEGPVAATRLAYDAESGLSNDWSHQLSEISSLDLTLAGTASSLTMLEGSAKEVAEELVGDAFSIGHEVIKALVAFQKQIQLACGKEKCSLESSDVTASQLESWLTQEAFDTLVDLLRRIPLQAAKLDLDKLEQVLLDRLAETELTWTQEDFQKLFQALVAKATRRLIVDEGLRPDRRGLKEIRPLDVQIDKLPSVHGSGLFTRGQTQVLSSLTLAPMSEAPLVDGLAPAFHQRFTHHYNFPAYSVGETGRYGAPGRRELGHGALGERALAEVLPSLEDFPYAIRLVAEVLESNGSSSQAAICAGSLALMAGGVPISAPVAGIAMGLVVEGDKQVILTDIQGAEDHFGDMDFKVAGTQSGITALQMDIKVSGLSVELLTQALAQAKQARLEILATMAETIAQPRPSLAATAPRIARLVIPVEKLNALLEKVGKPLIALLPKRVLR